MEAKQAKSLLAVIRHKTDTQMIEKFETFGESISIKSTPKSHLAMIRKDLHYSSISSGSSTLLADLCQSLFETPDTDDSEAERCRL